MNAATRRDLALLFFITLALRLLVILPIQQPGYMDAAYSYDIALNLAYGQGFTEPFLWNYLDDPAGLPHPSHLYWMPLSTLLAWVGLTLFGQTYQAAQVPFAVLSAVLPLVSYWVALRSTASRRHGWLAGLLTVFSGFYLLYWNHTDNFTPFAVTGSLCLVAAWQASRAQENGTGVWGWALGAGVLAGLSHLSRADGPLLLVAIGLVWGQALITNIKYQRAKIKYQTSSGYVLWVIWGYGLTMLPWLIRNWTVVGTPFPTAGTQSMWLTTYDDLFSYGRELSPHAYFAWGWGNILRSKLSALWINTQTLIAVFCMVFLLPLVPIGWWRLRRNRLYQLAGWYGLLLFLAMTFVFTFPGPRGGLFHSGGALLPFIFAAGVAGLDDAIEWISKRRRGWDAHMAKQVFGAGLVILALLVSGFVTYPALSGTRWRGGDTAYSRLAEWLQAQGQADAIVMVGDPPGYWFFGGGPSIVVPNEPVETTLAVADRYGASYLVLDENRPKPLAPLYAGEESHPRLRLVQTLVGDLRIYQIRPPD